MPAKPRIDYAMIEEDWRAGIKSPRQLAIEYTKVTGQKVSHTAIVQHFDKRGVPRNLASRISQKADAIVQASIVTPGKYRVTKKEDVEIIEKNAELQAGIKLAHRDQIQRARALTTKLLNELDLSTDGLPELIQLGELMAKPDDKGIDKLNEIYMKVISMPGRVDSMKKLSEVLRITIALEREAYGIKTEEAAGSGVRAVLLTPTDARL